MVLWPMRHKWKFLGKVDLFDFAVSSFASFLFLHFLHHLYCFMDLQEEEEITTGILQSSCIYLLRIYESCLLQQGPTKLSDDFSNVLFIPSDQVKTMNNKLVK